MAHRGLQERRWFGGLCRGGRLGYARELQSSNSLGPEMRRNIHLAAALTITALAAPAVAQQGRDPFVFVSDRERNGSQADPTTLAWYLLPMAIRPTGTTVAGVPVSAIDELRQRQLEDRPAIAVESWCFANALSDRSFVSSSRVVQTHIEQSFANNPDHHFQLRGRFTGGNELTAIVGHFETCGGETGSFIVLMDQATSPPSLAHVDVLPYISGLQYMRLVDGHITVSTCFECGDVNGLFYDQRRRRFYWEALGD